MRHLEDVVNPRSEKCKTGEDIPNMLKYWVFFLLNSDSS